MSTIAVTELHKFHHFLSEKLNNGGAHLSPEEVLEEWRDQHPDPEEFEDDVAAIQAALDDVANGDRGVPLDEFDHEFRRKHNIPPIP